MKVSITAEEIKELTDEWLGATLVALVSGTTRREAVAFWCVGYVDPEPDEMRRLAFALEILQRVKTVEDSKETAVLWFTGANVGEDRVSPAEAIRADRFEEVLRSAQGIIDDTPFSAL